MEIRELARERVRNGMFLLDMHVPGWREKINLEKLKLSCCMQCVIGQLWYDGEEGYGTERYKIGCAALGLPSFTENRIEYFEKAILHGFVTDADHDDIDYETLTDVWIEEIQKDLAENKEEAQNEEGIGAEALCGVS